MTGRGRSRYSGREASSANPARQAAGRPPDSDAPVDANFATGAAIAIGVFALIVLAPLAYRLYDTDAADAVDRMAVLTTLALLIVGIVVLLLGVYLVLIEFPGRIRPHAEREAATGAVGMAASRDELPLLGAIARLRPLGVMLLLTALVPLVAAAWVAESGADREPGAAATATARPASTRTPSPGTTTPTP